MLRINHLLTALPAFTGDQGVQAASHQRQLSLRHAEVQQRLIDNQGLLNALTRPAASCSSSSSRGGSGNVERLDELLDELRARVERDKEALRQWTALGRPDDQMPPPAATGGTPGLHHGGTVRGQGAAPGLAARLLRFAGGCALALQLMSGDGTPVSCCAEMGLALVWNNYYYAITWCIGFRFGIISKVILYEI